MGPVSLVDPQDPLNDSDRLHLHQRTSNIEQQDQAMMKHIKKELTQSKAVCAADGNIHITQVHMPNPDSDKFAELLEDDNGCSNDPFLRSQRQRPKSKIQTRRF